MTMRTLPLLLLAASASAQTHPDFQGIWNNSTATPVERPAQFKDKPFLTKEEAARWEQQLASRNVDPEAKPGSIGTYNVAFREFGSKVVRTMRSSMVTDPPDGRIPALTPAAAAEMRRRQQAARHPDGPEDLGIQDQCLMFPTGTPPMLPYTYNSNYKIIQTKDSVVIHAEMIHDTRIIAMGGPTTGRAHVPASVRLWLGDSVGHWEGSTLVVDTTNFVDKTSFFGSDRNMHLVERFGLLDRDTILYRFEVDDPTAFTRPWKGELTMARAPGPMFEYACHEGNSEAIGLLNGFRTEERAAGKER